MSQNLDNVKFLHPIGASTFKYGVTIPVEAQTERMRAIEKGGKVAVNILFGTEEPVMAEIRRLNNNPGHLQFRYENKSQERLRRYLSGIFGSTERGSQSGSGKTGQVHKWEDCSIMNPRRIRK